MLYSIITVAYNSEKIIRKTLESALHQTYREFEYIIIDGASTDSTLSIVNSYKDKFQKIKIVSEKDKGIYNAMNKGASLASGEYLLFLNSEDYYDNDYLTQLSDQIDKQPSDCYIGDVFVHREDSTSFISKVQLDEIFFRMPFNHQGTLIRRSLFMKLNGFDENLSIAADWDLFLRAYINNYSFYKYSGCHVNFHLGGVSSTKDYHHEKEYIIKKNLHQILNIDYSDISCLFLDEIFTDSPQKQSILARINSSENKLVATLFLYNYSLFINRRFYDELNRIKSKKSYVFSSKVRNNTLLMKMYRFFN